jgi:hypothetical protein
MICGKEFHHWEIMLKLFILFFECGFYNFEKEEHFIPVSILKTCLASWRHYLSKYI